MFDKFRESLLNVCVLTEEELKIRLVHLTTDGASVMYSQNNGVAGQFKRICDNVDNNWDLLHSMSVAFENVLFKYNM